MGHAAVTSLTKVSPYADVESENKLLGNLESVFASIAARSENISTIYIGTETGLLISYDPNSGICHAGNRELL